MGMGGQRHAPAVLPPVKTRYTLYRRLGGPQGRSGRVREISPSPGFDPRTVQLVTSRYTDCAIQAEDVQFTRDYPWMDYPVYGLSATIVNCGMVTKVGNNVI